MESERGMSGVETKAKELNEYGFDTLFLLHASRRSQALAARFQCDVKIGFEAMTHAGSYAFRSRYGMDEPV